MMKFDVLFGAVARMLPRTFNSPGRSIKRCMIAGDEVVYRKDQHSVLMLQL